MVVLVVGSFCVVSLFSSSVTGSPRKVCYVQRFSDLLIHTFQCPSNVAFDLDHNFSLILTHHYLDVSLLQSL